MRIKTVTAPFQRTALILTAASLAFAAIVLGGRVSHASGGSSTGSGTVTVVFNNREGSNPTFAFPNLGSVDDFVSQSTWHGDSQTPKLLLADNANLGTFKMRYLLNERGVPKFDTFVAKNVGGVPFQLQYVSEDETFLPERTRDNSKLLVCLNEGCDANVFFPDTAFVPPFTLAVLQPGQSAEFKVGLMLSPDANWAEWDNSIQHSRLHFQAVAQ